MISNNQKTSGASARDSAGTNRSRSLTVDEIKQVRGGTGPMVMVFVNPSEGYFIIGKENTIRKA